MTDYNAVILEAAGQYLGQEEWPGARHNPTIRGFFDAVGHGWVKDDETAWCAAFVGAVLAQCGLPHTGKLNARSYLEWGQPVPMADARPGDIVVLWRGSRSSWQGHVGVLVRFDGDRAILRGGNQGDKVSDAPYPVTRILQIRRADGGAEPLSNRPVLREGDRGAFVLDAQQQLYQLRYFAGARDGIFGPLVKAAVMAFQSDNKLVTDGVIGRLTWAKLSEAAPKRLRDLSERDLADKREPVVVAARQGERAMTGLEATAATTFSLGGMMELASAAQRAEGALETAQRLVLQYWPILIALLALFLFTRYGKKVLRRIIGAQVESAQRGQYLSD